MKKYYKIIIIIMIILINCQLINTHNDETKEIDEGWGEINYYQEIQKLYNRYLNPIHYDSLIIINNNSLYINYKYYYNYENSFIIPKNYFFDDYLEKLKVYEFAVDLKIYYNHLLIFDSTIDNKFIFQSIDLNIYGQLNIYGVIWGFYFRKYNIENDMLEFHISFSIPITDLGVGLTLSIDKEGKYCLYQYRYNCEGNKK